MAVQKVQLVHTENPGELEAVFQLPPGLDLELSSVVARIDGAGAAGTFNPVLEVLSQDDKVIARVPTDTDFAVGDTGVVTWSPFLRRHIGATPSSGATYAWIGRTTTQAIVTGTPTTLDMTSSGTNDSSAFNPDLTNNRIELLKTGIYAFSGGFVAQLAGNPWSMRLITNLDAPLGSGQDLPIETIVATGAGVDPYYERSTVCIVNSLAGFSPPEVHIVATQTSGSNKNVLNSMLRAVRLGDYS